MKDDFYVLIVAMFVAVLMTINVVWDVDFFDLEPITLDNQVTFSDVKPIFENRCLKCHSAPHWNWTDYDVAYRKRDRIKSRVWISRSMPPNGMPQEERALVRDWVDGGAKR